MAWGMVRQGAEVHDSPTLAARNSVATIDDRAGGTRRVFQSPYRFSSSTSGVLGPASHRGEDNEAVLADWLGASPAEAAQRAASGSMRQDDQARAVHDRST